MVTRKVSKKQAPLNTKKAFIIPYKSALEISKLTKDSEDDVLVILGKKQINFDFQNTQVITQLIEGEFPEYDKYIPAETKSKLSMDRIQFLQALKRASVLSAPEYQGVKIDVSKNKLVVSKTTPQLGEYKEEIEVEYPGKTVSFGFNPAYLIDVLKVIEEDAVVFDVYDAEKPVVLRNNGYLHLALPMRIN